MRKSLGEQLKIDGMEQALTHANETHENWGNLAHNFLVFYCVHKKDPFLVEEVRLASMYIIPEPPSLRAWGSIVIRAAREGLVKKVGYKAVKNPRAHQTPATLWKSLLNF